MIKIPIDKILREEALNAFLELKSDLRNNKISKEEFNLRKKQLKFFAGDLNKKGIK